MYREFMIMPNFDFNTITRITCVVFSTSAITAFVFATLRLLKPEWFYIDELEGRNLLIHYAICGLMLATAVMGVVNSGLVMARSAYDSAKCITTWLLFDSLFETCRVVYSFIGEVVLSGEGDMQTYDLFVSGTQYFIDSFLYCQMILRH